MKSEDFDISLDLIRLMDAQHAKEFEILLSRFSSDAQIKHYTTFGLFEIARAGCSEINIRAIKLIGTLKLPQAESKLLKILETSFSEKVMQDLAISSDKHLPEHKLMTALLDALLVLGSKKGSEIANRTRDRFVGCWISSYLDGVRSGLGFQP